MAGRRLATAYRLGLYPGMQIQPVNDSDAMYPSRQSGSDKITANSMIRPPITARKGHRDCMVFRPCLPPEVLETFRRQLGIAHGVLDILVA